MKNTNIIIKEYFSNEYITEITMIQDADKIVWFKGCEVAFILAYSVKKQAIRNMVEMEDKKKMNELLPAHDTFHNKLHPHTTFINEYGLYSLIHRSKLDGAKKFKKWITKEVLPSIMNSGSYSVKKNIDDVQLKLRDFQLKEYAILMGQGHITDVKLRQAFRDRLMNEIKVCE